MLHNKSLKIFVSLYLTISMADFLSFQVLVDLRFFFVQNLFFCVTKIGVERLLNFVNLIFIYLYWQSIYFFFSIFPTRTSRGRGMTYLSPLNQSQVDVQNSREYCNHPRHRTLQCWPLRKLLVVNKSVFPDFAIHNKMQLFQLKVIILLHNQG